MVGSVNLFPFALARNPQEQMELPFYLISRERPGVSWDGLVSLHGDDLHFELKGAGEDPPTEFDIPLAKVQRAEFQRGLVSRKLNLKVGSEEMRKRFPAGVTGEEVHLMVARDDADFGSATTEVEYERLAGEIALRTGAGASPAAGGLAS